MKKLTIIAVALLSASVSLAQGRYDKIEEFDTYQNSWARVKLNDKYGFIDKKGREVVAPKYDLIDAFDVYRQGWALVIKDGKKGFIDRKGREIVEPKYHEIDAFDVKLDGCAEVMVKNQDVCQYTFIDKKGRELSK